MLRHVAPADYAYVLIRDDDVFVPPAFVDEYMALVRQYDFALAQPARTMTVSSITVSWSNWMD